MLRFSKRNIKTARFSKRKTLVAKLDTLFSLFIRLRDKTLGVVCCPLCGGNGTMQCFHFITRSKHSVRWNPLNAIAACAGCNIRYEHDQEFVEYVINHYRRSYGDKMWEALKQKSHEIAKFSIDDLLEIKADLELKLHEAAKIKSLPSY